jgi:DNA mismatch repair protein MutS
MSAITPMMQQYLEIKEQYDDCILFFRLGDFYEMFFSDAEIASRELEITLTGRDCGLEERAPMCGVPFHAADSYIARLISKGYKVAICEQVEDPSQAKGIVKREVVRVVTPGTITDLSQLDDKKNNYLVCIYNYIDCYGLAAVDLSTGEFLSTYIDSGNSFNKLLGEIAKYAPSEIIVNQAFIDDKDSIEKLRSRFNSYLSEFDEGLFINENTGIKVAEKFGQEVLEGINIYSLRACEALLEYLHQTQKVNLNHIQRLNTYKIEEYMVIDYSTRRNLELTETMREKSRKGTLLWVLDRTMTSMGGRCLRKWIEQPLINTYDIYERLNGIEELKEKFMARMELRELLKRVYDIERLMSKVTLGSVNCRDLIALKNSLEQVPYIVDILKDCESSLLTRIYNGLDPLEDICSLIEKSIVDDPPVAIKEGGIIKDGYNAEVDELRTAKAKGKDWLAELEATERERTGIKNLKIGFNKLFGYYLEVTKSYFDHVPENYIRKQTLANSERYITQELKEMENKILGAEEKLMIIEYSLFCEIKDIVANEIARIKTTAKCLAELDALCSLAEVADREGYNKPEVTLDDTIEIIEGRHPVVEKMLELGEFVPNDTLLDLNENRLSIITGPNMAGKSTYMRQVALIVLMAQIGSFVPADSAKIGIVDRIFTRVGASDDLASGKSTFMVEMSEVANIMNNATSRSLLILDEIGRGTSTYDGLSIAWAVIEYVSDRQVLGSRTLFATHYHELTELEGRLTGIKNYCVSVKEKGEEIIFLRKIVRGGADGSYGIQVARLAGLPEKVLERAKEILNELEEADISKNERRNKKNKSDIPGQMDIFALNAPNKDETDVINYIKNINISTLTPLEALNTLDSLQKKLEKGKP